MRDRKAPRRERLPEEGPPGFEIRILPDAEEAARAAAIEFFHAAADAIANREVFNVALSGGRTPVALFHALVREPFRGRTEWDHTRFFFVDERCVPPDHERSNYRLAKENLFDPLEIPAGRVFRMRGEDDPQAAASDYETVLTRELDSLAGVPRLDFALLGVGGDGHTASLFPDTSALSETRRPVAANRARQLNEWRLTLTLPALNASRWDVFLVTGGEKARVVAEVAQHREGSRNLPASLVRPTAGSLIWIVDEAAAAEL